jgi:hypothetical protein
MNNTLVIYCYFEKNNDYQNNLVYFLDYGLEESNDYIFVINGLCTLKIPKKNNIKVLHRNNIGYDFSAYGEALKSINIQQYKYFFFINTSVRGPFLPDYVKMSWTIPFKNLLKNDVKLVGTTINLAEDFLSSNSNKHYYGKKKYYTHVQSQMFATDLECLKLLISKGIFDLFTENNFLKIIILREIGMSYHVLNNNWNISCVLPEYQNIDYRTLNVDFNPTSIKGEMNYKDSYFNRTLHPYEAIFIKTNRDLFNNQIQSISTHNLNQKITTIIFIFYYDNEDIKEYLNHKYVYLVRINNYYDIYDFLVDNTFLWINKENIGVLLFNEITDISFINNIDNNELVVVNTKTYYNYDNNLLIKKLNHLNLNKQKFNDFSSFITKTKYFIGFMKIYKTFLNNNKDNILLIKILTSYLSNLNIKTYTMINNNSNNNNKNINNYYIKIIIIIIIIIIFVFVLLLKYYLHGSL